MSGHVDDPVLPGRLLLVVPLVLAGGIGVIDHRSANTAIIDIVIAPRPCSSLAVKRSDFGSTMVDPVAFMVHVHHVRDPDLAVVDLPVALLGDPLLLGLGGGRTGRGGRGSAEASEIALDPNRPRADEVKFREMSREIFERAYLPDEWKPAYNAARRTRSQLHWVDLREHPRSFDELGGVLRTTADRKGYGDTDEEWSRAYRRNGAVRLTITLPDGATKVMYAPDPTPRAWFDDFLATTSPVEFLPQDYIRGVLLGDDHMEPREIKLYG